jgi:hypothetical protein
MPVPNFMKLCQKTFPDYYMHSDKTLPGITFIKTSGITKEYVIMHAQRIVDISIFIILPHD